ncbi:hypothetical protein KAW96_02600 [candidate division WOR-3 bacterium]|nr:hypothetical protein [candidate division WOR-3 bacterium]
MDEIKLESIGLKFTGKPRKLRGVFEDSMFVVVAETLIIEFDITGYFKVCNTGNDVATMTFYTILDTTSTEDILRKWLLAEKQLETRWDTISLDFELIDVTPGETLTLPLKKRFQFITDTGEAVLHLFILYENQFGALFDTYCWVRFECPLLTDIKKQSGKYFIPSKEKILNAITPTKSRASYRLYKPYEKEKAISIIKKDKVKN